MDYLLLEFFGGWGEGVKLDIAMQRNYYIAPQKTKKKSPP
jgi:hypothetical protein